jgi:four helix bundle protein
MVSIKRFEDVIAWQKARKATHSVYRVTSEGEFARDFGLRDQLRRASVSVMANIAEGFSRRSDREFANFLNMARASAAECQSHLYVSLDLTYIDQETFDYLYSSFEECSRMAMALIKHLRT